jgi:hypothetical protein
MVENCTLARHGAFTLTSHQRAVPGSTWWSASSGPTTNRICRGVFTSVPDLEVALHDYVRIHKRDPKPFIWTKSATDSLEKSPAPVGIEKVPI